MNAVDTLGFTGGGQLILLSEGARADLDIKTITLAASESEPVFYPGFSEGQGIIIPKDKNGPNFRDEHSLDAFAEMIKKEGGTVVTTEWENVPWESLKYLEENHGLVCRPAWRFLQKIQDRKTEKELAKQWGGEPVPYGVVNSLESLHDMIGALGVPCILKTRTGGYDGKGQWKIGEDSTVSGKGPVKSDKTWSSIDEFWKNMFPSNSSPNLILEKRIELKSEMSIIAAIGVDGAIKMIGPILNHHTNGILDASLSDAPIDEKDKIDITAQAITFLENAMRAGYVGPLTIEFFIGKDRTLYVNEFAPRTHNSGHTTLDSSTHNQNHLWIASVAGKSISDLQTEVRRKVLMLNILDHDTLDLLREKFGDISEMTLGEGLTLKLYDYHKTPNADIVRKVGHLNVYGSEVDESWEAIQNGQLTLAELSRDIRHRINEHLPSK